MKKVSYSNVVATLALVVAVAALCVGGAIASGVIVTSKQIKNGSILSQDIHKSAVKSSDIGVGAVGSADIKTGGVESADIGTGQVSSEDIGDGEVEPGDVTMPDPVQIQKADPSTAQVSATLAPVVTVGTYMKEDPNSVLEVTWTGTAEAPTVSCVFQLRVDGQPSAAGAGAVYVANVGANSVMSVSVTALFPALPIGQHSVEVWARTPSPAFTDPCTVGPSTAGIPQTFVLSEQII